MNSVELFNSIRALQAEQAAVPMDAEDRAERVFRLDGRIEEMQNRLQSVLADEQRARDEFVPTAPTARKSLAEMAFGPRAQFKGIQPGFRGAITIPARPDVVDPTIPAFADVPRGFIDTLQQSPTEAGVTYLRRGAKVNAAAQWSTGDKPESTYVWTEHSAPLTWIAHHAPISKTQASDYGQLESIIRGEMLLGLTQKKSTEAIVGANSAGITGITNTVGIQTHTLASGDNAYDAIRRMVTKVYLTSGFRPTHVAVAPQVNETLDLLKDDNKAYLQVKVGGRVWSLEIVEDLGLAIHDAVAGTTHYGMIVYASVGATWYTKETDNVEIGLVDDQFINNAYTLLAEGRHAFAVRFPDAFCYCEDAIPAVADASS